MFVKRDQQMILDILDKIGIIREDQAEKLLQRRYPGFSLNRTVTPLAVGGKVKRYSGYLSLPDTAVRRERTSAVDIMLLMNADLSEPFFVSRPFELTFFKTVDGKLWRYDVCVVEKGHEITVCTEFENIGAKYRKIIFLIDDKEQMKELWVPCEHCFAVKLKDKYEFYKEKGD